MGGKMSKEYYAQYRQKNIYKIRKAQKKYYLANKNKIAEKAREWKANNPEKVKEISKRYRAGYSEEKKMDLKDKAIKRYWDSPEKYREIARKRDNKEVTKRWRDKNKDKCLVYREKRRANGGRWITKKELQFIYERNIKDNGTLTCCLCNNKIDFGEDSLEHLLPLSRGGTNELNNLDIAHRKCNSSKRDKTLEEYKEYLNGK